MSILLTHGYFLKEDEVEQTIMKPYPPLGMLYISAYLDKHSIVHHVLDSTFLTEEDWMAQVESYHPEIVAFYVNLLTKVKILYLIKKLKSLQGMKDITIVFGGPDVTYNIENYLKNGADFLVVGEGEVTFFEFVKQFYSTQNYNDVKGLAYRSVNGELVKNKKRENSENMDYLPQPNRMRINIEEYLFVWKKYHGKRTLNISTQRGCPYTCRWCSKAVFGQSYRRRNPKLVVEEIEKLMDDYKLEAIWFVDDVFTIDHVWIIEFVDEMQRKGINIPFECITRAERLNDEVLKSLKTIGCFRIWIGAESGSQHVLNLMDRKVQIKEVKNGIELCRNNGIETGTFIMIGYPGETHTDILETIDYLKEADPDSFTITTTYPVKGTELALQIENNIVSEGNWTTSTDRQTDFKRTYTKKYYEHAIRNMVNEVYYYKEKQRGRKYGKKAILHKLKATISAYNMKKYL